MTLVAEKNEVTRERICRAAMTVLAKRGFQATVEEIASVAGVSARTVFRHYGSHQELVARALSSIYDELGGPVEGLPDPRSDLKGWLDVLALTAHRRNSDILGQAFWGFYNPPPETAQVILEVLAARRAKRRRWMDSVVDLTWSAAGGIGAPPRVLVETFYLLLSAHATHSLAADFDDTPEAAAVVSSRVLMDVLMAAVEEQRSIR
jgi:AcrR family transcriptional regulator